MVTVSTDSCQYAEFLLLQVVSRKVKDTESQRLVSGGFVGARAAAPGTALVDPAKGEVPGSAGSGRALR